MEKLFQREAEGIYRLKVPFEDLYTSVFLIISEEGRFLVDCATNAYDVDKVILPALEKMGFGLCDISAIVVTHRHSDHAGGLARITSLSESVRVVRDACELAKGIFTYSLAGHTDDLIGIFDGRTGTLISGDGLQGAGIGKYRCYTQNPEAYLETIEKIKNDERIKSVLFSHAYEPWNEDGIHGRDAVLTCLDECRKYVNLKGKK